MKGLPQQAFYRSWALLFLGLALLPCLALIYARNPEEQGFYPPCLFYALTGLYCPGCGILRGLHQLMHGNILAALSYNPIAMLVVPLVGLTCLLVFLMPIYVRWLSKVFLQPPFLWGLLVAVAAFWVLRNVPVYPFTALAP